MTAQSRSPPSSCEDEVRKMSGHAGQGFVASTRCSGGLGISSSCVTCAARWRCDVPRQSEPVSPPPMMTTRLPVARMAVVVGDDVARRAAVVLLEELHREVDAVELAPRDRQIARLARAAAEHDRVETRSEARRRHVDADVHRGAKGDPFGLHLIDAPIDEVLLHLEVGDAVAKQAANAIVALEQRDVVALARQLLRGGQPGRARADDRDALARLRAGETAAATRLCSNARSMMPRSTFLMVTGSSSMLSTHDASHGAGQTRPVTSGKLLVACRARDRVAADRPLYIVVVPVGDEVPERTAVVAERDAAIHAPRRPGSQSSASGTGSSNSFQSLKPLVDRPLVVLVALDLQKPADFTHGRPTSLLVLAGT